MTLMFAESLVAMTEVSLLSLEASCVIAMRMRVIMLGGADARTEAELMIREKLIAFSRADHSVGRVVRSRRVF